MCSTHRGIHLGFADGEFPPGTHICQIINDEEERSDALLRFLVAGLEDNEKAVCFSEKLDRDALAERLSAIGISLQDACTKGSLTLAGGRDVYFEGNRFDPERMLGMLKNHSESSRREGYAAARVIGEMIPEILTVAGGSRLLEYESRVSLLLREHPVTAVCQYDANEFNGAMIMDVLKVHPYMVVRGAVIHNPFFIPPEQFLS